MSDRSRVAIRVVPLDSAEAGDPRTGGTVEERLAAVAALSAEGWRLAGRSLPSYTRAEIPIVVRTLAEHRDEG